MDFFNEIVEFWSLEDLKRVTIDVEDPVRFDLGMATLDKWLVGSVEVLLAKFLLVKPLNFLVPLFLNNFDDVAFILGLEHWHVNLYWVLIGAGWGWLCLSSCHCPLECLLDLLSRVLCAKVQGDGIIGCRFSSRCLDGWILLSESLPVESSCNRYTVLLLNWVRIRVWGDLLSWIDLSR